MKKHYKWVMIGGVIIFLLPLIGIPNSWKMIIQFVVGLGLIGLALIEKQMFVFSETPEEPVFEESVSPEAIENNNNEEKENISG